MKAASPSLAVDASNTLDSVRLSGVQRLTLRVIEELSQRSDVRLSVLDGRSGQLRMLRANQRERLLSHFERDHQSWSSKLERRVAKKIPAGPLWVPQPDDWLVDIEPSWHAVQPRASLLPSLRCRTAALIHDVLPLRHPAWFPPESVARFTSWFEAHIAAGSRLLANSETTSADLADWLGSDSLPPVLRLGVDLVERRPVPENGLVLMIGTIEPRKGHQLILDAVDLLPDAPVIDIVGSAGWIDRELLDRLRVHTKFRWHHDLTDRQLDELWDRTSLLIQPSLAEGFGLPVAEALARGIPVLASDLPVFAESSKGCAQLVGPTPEAWAHALGTGRPSEAPPFRPYTWAETAADLLRALD